MKVFISIEVRYPFYSIVNNGWKEIELTKEEYEQYEKIMKDFDSMQKLIGKKTEWETR